MTETIRVRQLFNALNSVERMAIKKLLPPRMTAPDIETHRYPAALMAAFPKEYSYSLTGLCAEHLLRLPVAEITLDRLLTVASAIMTESFSLPPLSDIAKGKITKSKTTEPFLDHLRVTRAKIDAIVGPAAAATLRFEEEVGTGQVRGHPDMRTDTQIFEVKLTGQLKQNWPDFLLQTFAYGALVPEATDLYIVLPLQEYVWHWPCGTAWSRRTEFAAALAAAAAKHDSTAESAVAAALLIAMHNIGNHIAKRKTLPETVRLAPTPFRPWQIFLAGPQSSRLSIADAELAETAAVVQETGKRMFVHSPYIINLCQAPGTADDYHTALLIKNLQYAVVAGFHGVVVHVGKSTSQSLETAMIHMRTNIQTALQHATPECPILLETPAGQGTEVLRTWEDFVGFVREVNDPRLRICVDTCHVFACGAAPFDYIQRLLTDPTVKPLLRLIHFNDSATPCGSCVDRHAFVGTGHIGIDGMSQIAALCSTHEIPMLIE